MEKNTRIVSFEYENTALFAFARQIRDVVFVQEQNVAPEIEFDGLDKDCRHFLLFEKETPVATARYRETEKGYKLERFAVLKEHRGKHYGAELVKAIMSEVKAAGKKIYMNAQEYAEKFYEKFGFQRVGELFYEAEIPHYEMVFSPQTTQK